MKEAAFKELVASVRQAGRIRRSPSVNGVTVPRCAPARRPAS